MIEVFSVNCVGILVIYYYYYVNRRITLSEH